MSPLERRCRVLLRAYPAEYRRERGEEIITTLMEASPEGRSRLSLRDARSLVAGGLRARAALNRRFTTAVNLRLAVLAGISIYLGAIAAGDVDDFVVSQIDRGVPTYGPFGWPALVAGLLIGVLVVLVWLARRPVVIGAAALAAAAAASYVGFSSQQIGFVVVELVCLVAVVALTVRAQRRSSAWLWLVGAVVATLFLPGYLQFVTYRWTSIALGLEISFVVIALACVVIDARLLVAVATYLLLLSVPVMLDELSWGVNNWFDNPTLLFACAVAAFAVWQLRRQSLRPGRPVQ
jgi:hypothetical protein